MEDLRNNEETSVPSTPPPPPACIWESKHTFYLSRPQTPEHNDF